MAKIYHKLGINQYFAEYFSEALDNASQAIEIRSRALGNVHPELASSYFLRGTIYNYIGRPEKGLEDLKTAIRIHENRTGTFLGHIKGKASPGRKP